MNTKRIQSKSSGKTAGIPAKKGQKQDVLLQSQDKPKSVDTVEYQHIGQALGLTKEQTLALAYIAPEWHAQTAAEYCRSIVTVALQASLDDIVAQSKWDDDPGVATLLIVVAPLLSKSGCALAPVNGSKSKNNKSAKLPKTGVQELDLIISPLTSEDRFKMACKLEKWVQLLWRNVGQIDVVAPGVVEIADDQAQADSHIKPIFEIRPALKRRPIWGLSSLMKQLKHWAKELDLEIQRRTAELNLGNPQN